MPNGQFKLSPYREARSQQTARLASVKATVLNRSHLWHLQLKSLRPITVEANARAMRRTGQHFEFKVTALSPAQLMDYFTLRLRLHSWSGVQLVLHGLKSFTEHALGSLGPCPASSDRPRPAA